VDTDDVVADIDGGITDDHTVLISKEAVRTASHFDSTTKSATLSSCKRGLANTCVFGWLTKWFNQSKHEFQKN